MKGFMVFLTLALVASASAGTVDKGIIGDAIAMKKCLENAITSIQGSVSNLLGTVNQLQTAISTNTAQLKVCQAIGGDNPSTIQQIQQATCIMALVAKVQSDVTSIVDNVKTSVNELAGAGDLIGSCLPKDAPQNKNIITDALALKACIEKAITTIQDSVQNLLNTINDVQTLIESNVSKLEDCKALGAGGSIINQIQEATCILSLVDSVKEDVTTLVQNVQNNIDIVLGSGDLIAACL